MYVFYFLGFHNIKYFITNIDLENRNTASLKQCQLGGEDYVFYFLGFHNVKYFITNIDLENRNTASLKQCQLGGVTHLCWNSHTSFTHERLVGKF